MAPSLQGILGILLFGIELTRCYQETRAKLPSDFGCVEVEVSLGLGVGRRDSCVPDCLDIRSANRAGGPRLGRFGVSDEKSNSIQI